MASSSNTFGPGAFDVPGYDPNVPTHLSRLIELASKGTPRCALALVCHSLQTSLHEHKCNCDPAVLLDLSPPARFDGDEYTTVEILLWHGDECAFDGLMCDAPDRVEQASRLAGQLLN